MTNSFDPDEAAHNEPSHQDICYLQNSVTVVSVTQGCHGQGKISGKLDFFQVREKSGKFVDGQGNLERTWKVRERSGNLKKNGYGRQSSENLFRSRGEGMYFLRDSLSASPSSLEATLAEKNLLPWGANSFL